MVRASCGTSSAVRIARTPGSASARLRSLPTTRACGRSLSMSLQNSMPSARIVFGVAGAAGDLRHDVGGDVVRADESCRHATGCYTARRVPRTRRRGTEDTEGSHNTTRFDSLGHPAGN